MFNILRWHSTSFTLKKVIMILKKAIKALYTLYSSLEEILCANISPHQQ